MDAYRTQGMQQPPAIVATGPTDGQIHHMLAMGAPSTGHAMAHPPTAGTTPAHADGPRYPRTTPVAAHALRASPSGCGHPIPRPSGVSTEGCSTANTLPLRTRWWQSTAGQHQKPPGTPYPGWRAVPKKQTIKWTTSHPKRAYLLQYIHNYLAEGHERNNDYVQTNAAAAEIINQGIAVYATPKIKPATTTPWTTATMGVCIHAYQPTTPCRLPCPDNQNTVIFAHASGTIGHTLAAGGAALELRPDTTGQLRQHHLTATTIFRASLHGDLKKPAMIVDSVCPAC